MQDADTPIVLGVHMVGANAHLSVWRYYAPLN